jgi:hypothetical protein
MWTVTSRFLTTIPIPHQVVTTVALTPPGGSPIPLTMSAGTVTTDRSQRIRRTANLAVKGGSDLFETLSIPGARVAIDHGWRYGGNDQELVPMIRGELSSAALQLGDGLIQISVADLWQGVASANYLTPFTPAKTATRTAVILSAITDVYPGVTVHNTATDTGTVATEQAWSDRAGMISSLANDGGMDAYFAPDGSFVLKDAPQITDPVAWLIKTGQGGTLEALTRSRPLDKIYNAVVLTPATADAGQTWDLVTAVITDTSNPRHPSNLGRIVPYVYAAPSILTEAEALDVAEAILTKVQGSTETLSLGAISNPALEAGDIVRAVTPIDGGNTIVSHFLDSAQTDLVTGSMSCGTRASEEVTA